MRALITGTTKGIGKSIKCMLIQKGVEVYSINRRKESFDQTSTNIICDLSNIKEVEKVCEEVRLLSIDILINNAGAGKPVLLEDLKADQLIREINLNLIAPFLLIQAVISHMQQKNFGRIIKISSISGNEGTPYLYAYSAAKAGLNTYAVSISRTITNKNITINTISPGGIETEMAIEGREIISSFRKLSKSVYQDHMIESMCLGRLIQPDEVAAVVEFLIRSESNYITGQKINICGALEVK